MNKAFIEWWCNESGWCKDGNWQDDEGTSEFNLAQEAWQRGAGQLAEKDARIAKLEADAMRWRFAAMKAQLHGCPRDGYHLRIPITQDAPGLYGPAEMIDAAMKESEGK